MPVPGLFSMRILDQGAQFQIPPGAALPHLLGGAFWLDLLNRQTRVDNMVRRKPRGPSTRRILMPDTVNQEEIGAILWGACYASCAATTF